MDRTSERRKREALQRNRAKAEARCRALPCGCSQVVMDGREVRRTSPWTRGFRKGLGGDTWAAPVIRCRPGCLIHNPPAHLVIVTQPGRCGGRPTVGHTRMAVDSVVSYYQMCGGDIDAVLDDYPHWTREQVEAALRYYEGHREEIDGIIRERQEVYEEGLAAQRERT